MSSSHNSSSTVDGHVGDNEMSASRENVNPNTIAWTKHAIRTPSHLLTISLEVLAMHQVMPFPHLILYTLYIILAMI